MRTAIHTFLLLGFVGSSAAAELPTKIAPPKRAQASAHKCVIAGREGFLTPDGSTCLAISGYVSAGVTKAH